MTARIEVRGVHKEYRDDDVQVPALRGVDLTVSAGEFVAITGPSGCGKSTLLHLVGGLDQPTAGEVLLDGTPLSRLSRNAVARLRAERVGFIFQLFNLLPGLSAAENVALPAVIAGRRPAHYRDRVADLLDGVGLAAKADRLPGQLSGGEQQRVAIARALVMQPAVILADEPTGNLDSRAGDTVLALLRTQHTDGQTVVLVTHDAQIASHADRLVFMRDGRLTDETDLREAPERPTESSGSALARLVQLGDETVEDFHAAG